MDGSNHNLQLLAQSLTVNKNGYLYLWVSNSSSVDVFFDGLVATHKSGPLLQEDHYYPFGLGMKGICSRVREKLLNKFGFNGGIELEESLLLGVYETPFRLYDPSIGRFFVTDKLAEVDQQMSQYSFAFCNPANFNDSTGLTTGRGPDEPTGKLRENKRLEEVIMFCGPIDKPELAGPISALPLIGNGASYFGDFINEGISGVSRRAFNQAHNDVQAKIRYPLIEGYVHYQLSILEGLLNGSMAIPLMSSIIDPPTCRLNRLRQMIERKSEYGDGSTTLLLGPPVNEKYIPGIVKAMENNDWRGVVNSIGYGGGYLAGGAIIGAVPRVLSPVTIQEVSLMKSVQPGDELVQVYRVYGGKSKTYGASWTTINPLEFGQRFRNLAGLLNVNSGERLITGYVKWKDIVKIRPALPFDGNAGGLPEVIIPNAEVNIINASNILLKTKF